MTITPVYADATSIAMMTNFVSDGFNNFPLLAVIFYTIVAVNVGVWGFRLITGVMRDV